MKNEILRRSSWNPEKQKEKETQHQEEQQQKREGDDEGISEKRKVKFLFPASLHYYMKEHQQEEDEDENKDEQKSKKVNDEGVKNGNENFMKCNEEEKGKEKENSIIALFPPLSIIISISLDFVSSFFSISLFPGFWFFPSCLSS